MDRTERERDEKRIAVFWFLSIANMQCHFKRVAYSSFIYHHFSANYFPLFVVIVCVFISIFIQFFYYYILCFIVLSKECSMFYGWICEICFGVDREECEKLERQKNYIPSIFSTIPLHDSDNDDDNDNGEDTETTVNNNKSY